MTAARRALRGAAGMTDRSRSLQRMVRRCGHWVSALHSEVLNLSFAGRAHKTDDVNNVLLVVVSLALGNDFVVGGLEVPIPELVGAVLPDLVIHGVFVLVGYGC